MTRLSQRQLSWLADALGNRDERGRNLGPAELQLFTVYVCRGSLGWCKLPNRRLAPMLTARGWVGNGAKHSAIRAARRELARRGLIKCKQQPYKPARRNPKTGKLLAEPYEIRITARGDRSLRWPGADEWAGRILDARLRPITLKAALMLVAALDSGGQLAATRKELEQLLSVQRDVAVASLRLLAELGHISLHEDRSTRPAVFTIRAQLPPQAAADGSVREPRPPEGSGQGAAGVVERPQPTAPRRLAAAQDEAPAAPGARPTRTSRGRYPSRLVAVTSPQPASAPVSLATDGKSRGRYPSRLVAVTSPESASAPVPLAADDEMIAVLPSPTLAKPDKRATKADAEALWEQLSCPLFVQQAIEQASQHLKTGSQFQPRTLVAYFIQPVLDLQQRYPAQIVEKALRITVSEKKMPGELRRGSWNRTWTHYAAAICEHQAPRSMQQRGPQPGSNAHAAEQAKQLACTVRDLLEQAARLNARGEQDAAHEVRVEIRSHAADLAPLYEGSAERADYQLRLAFKQGSADLHVRRNRYALDYEPDWDPDATAEQPSAAATPPEPPPVSTDAAIGTESGGQLPVGAAPTNPAPKDTAPAAPTARGPRDLNALQVKVADPSDPAFQRELLSLAATHKGKVPLLLVGLDRVGAFPLTGPDGAPVKVSPTWELADAVRELRRRLLLADTA